MTDEQKDALEWLDNAIHRDAKWESVGDEMHRATLKRMLAQPRLPEEPNDELIAAMVQGFLWPGHCLEPERVAAYREQMRKVYRHQVAYLTAPKTKEVEVWRVEYVARDGRPQINVVGPSFDPLDLPTLARDEADRLRVLECSCIRVTGPHKQTVPA